MDMTLAWQALHPNFGASFKGISLSDGLGDSQMGQIRDAIWRFGVVLLPAQAIDDDQLYHFATRLGPVVDLNAYTSFTDRKSKVTTLSNVAPDGSLLPADHMLMRLAAGNELWHTDSTYVRPRAAISMLYGRTVPPVGGNTEFCDTRCAYEALPIDERNLLVGLTAVHSLLHSRKLTGFADFGESDRSVMSPIPRPLVEHHKESDREALCLASHIAGIVRMAEAEATALIGRLIDFATEPERVYSHSWNTGDLLLWDNRCTMHRVRPFDSDRYARDMRIMRIVDEADAS